MKEIDTNLLVRYITQDDTQQSRAASEFIEKNFEENSIFTSGMALLHK